VQAEVARAGLASFVARCTALLRGEQVDDAFLLVLAGPVARQVIDGREGGVGGHWPRVWAARGLLHAWDDTATAQILEATSDESWRVREMAAKVIAAHAVDDALEALGRLVRDTVPRVRAAAHRARGKLVQAGRPAACAGGGSARDELGAAAASCPAEEDDLRSRTVGGRDRSRPATKEVRS
jgi:hypothetical protein